MTKAGLYVVAALVLAAPVAQAEIRDIQHPFLMWTKKEAEAIRKRIETDDAARKQYEQMVARDGERGSGYPPFLNLFKYAVLGDEKAGETELNALRGFFGQRPPESVPGNPNTGNRPYRDDHWLDGVRYDVLHDLLTDQDKKQFRDTVENYMKWFRTKYGPWRRCTEQGTPRTGWLPNMQYPTVAGIHVLAVVTKEEALIKEVFESRGSLKWWLDYYVADGSFYMEEFGKYGSPVGAQLLWCEGLDRLGLPQYGYGYTAKPIDMPGHAGGGTARRYLESLIRAAYPRILRADGTPDYPVVTMGDAGTQAVVRGRNADGSGEPKWWAAPSMWGQTKMMHPFWWEIGHRRFPDAGFDYFLAQMRAPGEDTYLPSLYFGLGPIDSKAVKPPAVKSCVAAERGFALLRTEESPAYWESPEPAVALQFGMYYVHYVHDCFSILEYVADNRFVYNRMGRVGGGYAGGDICRDSTRGQGSAVTVDDLQIQPVDTGDQGSRNVRIRQRLTPPAKFVAVRAAPAPPDYTPTKPASRRATALYPDVDAERALVLTSEYLFDVFWLKSSRDRVYDWHVQGSGQIAGVTGAPWAECDKIPGARVVGAQPRMNRGEEPPPPPKIRQREVGGDAWSESLVGPGVGGNTVGVRVSMLEAPGTSLFTFALPAVDPERNATLMARRSAPGSVFVALHEPFKGAADAYRVAKFERIAQDEQGVAAAIIGKEGSGINDRILLRYGDNVDKPLTLAGGGESFTFSDYAYVRVGKETVTVDGSISSMQLKVTGSPRLILNGQKSPAAVTDGVMALTP